MNKIESHRCGHLQIIAIEPASGVSCTDIDVSQVTGTPIFMTQSYFGSCSLNQASFEERPICMIPDLHPMSMSLVPS